MTEFRALDALLASPVTAHDDGTAVGPSYTPPSPAQPRPEPGAPTVAFGQNVPVAVWQWAPGSAKPRRQAIEAVIRAGVVMPFDEAAADAYLAGACAAGWLQVRHVEPFGVRDLEYVRPEQDPDLSPKPKELPRTKMWLPERFARKIRKITDAETGEVFDYVDGSIRLPEQWVDHATGEPVAPPLDPHF